MYTANDIIGAISKLDVLERISNDCDEAWGMNPESEQAELAFDKAYKDEWNQRETIVKMITSFSKGVIDEKTARQLVKVNYRAKLVAALGI